MLNLQVYIAQITHVNYDNYNIQLLLVVLITRSKSVSFWCAIVFMERGKNEC